MKRFTAIILVTILTLVFILSGCSNKDDSKLSARETFDAYWDLSKINSGEAFQKYGYCADEDLRKELVARQETLSDCNVMLWEQLSDSLYVAIIQTWSFVDGNEFMELNGIHFVGLIDGEYKVMALNQIPEQLQEGVDLEKYRTYQKQFEVEMWDKIDANHLGPLDTYQAYYEAAEITLGTAFQQYGYCAETQHAETLAGTTDFVIHNELIQWYHLGNSLFVAVSEIRSSANDFANTKVIDYIAEIDGIYKVMDFHSIPGPYKQGVDFSQYPDLDIAVTED